jgi:hypothetical protein
LPNLALEDEADRIYAAEDLGYANAAAEAMAPLMERLATEPSRKVRETIFVALERIDRPEVRVHMAIAAGKRRCFSAQPSRRALLQRKGAAAAPVLLARMQRCRPGRAEIRARYAAAGISSPDVEPIYDAAMRDPDVERLDCGAGIFRASNVRAGSSRPLKRFS